MKNDFNLNRDFVLVGSELIGNIVYIYMYPNIVKMAPSLHIRDNHVTPKTEIEWQILKQLFFSPVSVHLTDLIFINNSELYAYSKYTLTINAKYTKCPKLYSLYQSFFTIQNAISYL